MFESLYNKCLFQLMNNHFQPSKIPDVVHLVLIRRVKTSTGIYFINFLTVFIA